MCYQLRVYNLSKKARDDVVNDLARFESWKPVKFENLKIAETDDPLISIVFDMEHKFFLGKKNSSDYFPLLKDEQILPLLPVAKVDSGAVKFVCNGANIMRPGIIAISGDFDKSGLLLVREEKYDKGIAVGKAMVGSHEMRNMVKGQAAENLHYVGDKFWEALKELEK